MNVKIRYFLTMLSLVALLGYETNLAWWQSILLGSLLNMWAWTLLSPHLTTEGWDDGVNGHVLRTRSSVVSRDAQQNSTSAAIDEDIDGSWLLTGLLDGNSSAMQANPANGLPMLNSVYDVNGNVFGTTWADDQRKHD